MVCWSTISIEYSNAGCLKSPDFPISWLFASEACPVRGVLPLTFSWNQMYVLLIIGYLAEDVVSLNHASLPMHGETIIGAKPSAFELSQRSRLLVDDWVLSGITLGSLLGLRWWQWHLLEVQRIGEWLLVETRPRESGPYYSGSVLAGAFKLSRLSRCNLTRWSRHRTRKCFLEWVLQLTGRLELQNLMKWGICTVFTYMSPQLYVNLWTPYDSTIHTLEWSCLSPRHNLALPLLGIHGHLHCFLFHLTYIRPNLGNGLFVGAKAISCCILRCIHLYPGVSQSEDTPS